jgi:hypothetical protein
MGETLTLQWRIVDQFPRLIRVTQARSLGRLILNYCGDTSTTYEVEGFAAIPPGNGIRNMQSTGFQLKYLMMEHGSVPPLNKRRFGDLCSRGLKILVAHVLQEKVHRVRRQADHDHQLMR